LPRVAEGPRIRVVPAWAHEVIGRLRERHAKAQGAAHE
jgi:hypothetical protein